jgi:homoserine kinase type II
LKVSKWKMRTSGTRGGERAEQRQQLKRMSEDSTYGLGQYACWRRCCGELPRVTDSPTVSMLWESVDPCETLNTRFGFRSATAAAGWVSDSLSTSWGITVDRCERVVISAWNAMAWVTAGERRLIAKWSAQSGLFAHLDDAASVTSWLQKSHIPVAGPIPTLDGRLLIAVGRDAQGRLGSTPPSSGSRLLVGVMPALHGQLLDVGEDQQVADAGRMLAVHEALATYPDPVDGRMRCGDEQLVHNDFRSANVLHDGAKVTAVLDLEEIKHDSRIADLAKAAVLLGCRYREWAPTSADVRAVFVDAYSSRLRVTSTQQRELDGRISAHLNEQGWA